MYLTATGNTQERLIVLNIISNKLSTYCCRAPYATNMSGQVSQFTGAVPQMSVSISIASPSTSTPECAQYASTVLTETVLKSA